MSISTFKPPYVRNGPLLEADNRESSAKSIQWHLTPEAVLEVRAHGASQAELIADRLGRSWNFHDPLVDMLRALLAQPDSSTVRADAKLLLTDIDGAENGQLPRSD